MSAAPATGSELVVGGIEDFPVGSHQVVNAGRLEIGIFNIGGKLFGLPNICPHQTGPVCRGKSVTGTLTARKERGFQLEWVHDGEIIVCPWHGLEFHVPTGRCLAFPEIQLRRYDVVTRDGRVIVRLSRRGVQADAGS